jgi:hypothetical protein
VKRAGSAVDLRPAPKARARRTRRSVSIAPPKAGRRTECARQEFYMRGALRRPASGVVIRMGGDAGGIGGQLRRELRGSGRDAPRARPEGDAPKSLPF